MRHRKSGMKEQLMISVSPKHAALNLRKPLQTGLCGTILFSLLTAQSRGADPPVPDLTEISLQDLMHVEITSVSKHPEQLANAAAATFVISSDDIRRSAATSIPEVLRMVPGLNVARIDSNKWAISSRGFNGRFANKLLVLIDGRSVYSPAFSGVYWEVQDTLLEDVERIEVIRGPGATLWGANAVNGVINIITRAAAQSQGGIVTVGGGSEESGFLGLRYGASLGDSSHGRFYLKGTARDEFTSITGEDSGDNWDMLRGGFRLDSTLSAEDELTLLGDLYTGTINQVLDLSITSAPYLQTVDDKGKVSGGNLNAKWQRTFSSSSDLTLQTYFTHSERQDAFESEERDTLDFSLQHQFPLGKRQDIIWGIGYRYTAAEFDDSSVLQLDPPTQNTSLYNIFIQDKTALISDTLFLTLGAKLEHNDYTGFELQPNLRLFWDVHDQHKLWAAVSRAVRTPSWAEQHSTLLNTVLPPSSQANPAPYPLALTVVSDGDFDSEELIAYEAGYRFLPSQLFSLDLAVFYNDYDELRSNELDALIYQNGYLEQPLRFDNRLKAYTYGLELAAIWQTTDWLQLNLGYTYLEQKISLRSEQDITQNSDPPAHQLSLRSKIDLREDLELDLWLRYVDDAKLLYTSALALVDVDSYISCDLRLAWRPVPDLELVLAGQNLFQKSHLEYVQENFTRPTEIQRGVYGKVTWKF